MVVFSNIHPGQEVEVLHGDSVYRGKVQYAGSLGNERGDFVGVELNAPVGNTDGMHRGRRYFFTKANHGIFTTAEMIRFLPTIRYLYNRYHPVSKSSRVDESLFSTPSPEVEDPRKKPSEISSDYEEYSARLCGSPRPYSALTTTYTPRMHQRYPLRHTVGNHIPAATMLRPMSARKAFSYKSSPVHTEYARLDVEPFVNSPSIPDYVMPLHALKQQMKSGWDGVKFPKHHNHYSLRDSLHTSTRWWNDVNL